MKGAVRACGVAGALLTLLTGMAVADVPLHSAGVLHQYCAEGETTPHPKLLVMRQVLKTDELATFGGTVFTVIYQSEAQPERMGKMSVRIRIKRVDGSVEKVGKIVVRQGETGSAESETWFPVAARRGDIVIWRYGFQNFDDPSNEDCLLLIAAVSKP